MSFFYYRVRKSVSEFFKTYDVITKSFFYFMCYKLMSTWYTWWAICYQVCELAINDTPSGPSPINGQRIR